MENLIEASASADTSTKTSANTRSVQQIRQSFAVNFQYDVVFTRNTFSLSNNSLIDMLCPIQPTTKLLTVIDQAVEKHHPLLINRLERYCQHHKIQMLPTLSVVGGEACKQDPEIIDQVYQAVEQHAIDRHSYILAIGGGAVIDAIGFAAATAHRGIRLIRMPSTVLGQNDAGVGVKTAVNYHQRKNYIGTFTPPHGVINDFNLLISLCERDKRAGIAEAIKVALIKDKAFFSQLCADSQALAKFEAKAMENMIIKGAAWHLNHIATSGDAFEFGSARPLDFGHWAAHKLEELSKHELRHGEAVAIGIAMDSIYSQLIGNISQYQLEQILNLLIELGFDLQPQALQLLDIKQALNEFREHLGGKLCITLLDDIGQGVEVNHIDESLMLKAVGILKQLTVEQECALAS
ncbi:3-dehydroquinate synthase [Saccharobesus litoralis]|uniref:3-dehydroquinate synthase n=1 Tax=Saccharobesus litoralis TaxID=2172099 RepID=A0A2S0VL57_9ALTE|nr:3-dehydroquinate synthase [Saccharobesus litoralis]AWB64943.1 3-dehydroquinate synthase [Saccharobesus litoralis]